MYGGVLTFHLRVAMVRRRTISVAERREMVEAAVTVAGLTPDEAKAMRHHVTNVSTREYPPIPVEITVDTCWQGQHYNRLERKLREQF
jgi:hypothetical protein